MARHTPRTRALIALLSFVLVAAGFAGGFALRDQLAASAPAAETMALPADSGASGDSAFPTAREGSAPASAGADDGSDLLVSWSAGSEPKARLVSFVQAATTPGDPGFIPEQNRIAVFDLDGTLYCQDQYTYFDVMAVLNWVLNEPASHADAELRAMAERVASDARAGTYTSETADIQTQLVERAFAGLPREDFLAYIERFAQTPADGFTGLARKDAFYAPMVEVVRYLERNGFTVYVVSAAVRDEVRVLVGQALGIPSYQVIGTDYTSYVSGQGGEEGADPSYRFTPEDQILIGSHLLFSDEKANKAIAISREIGAHPVLAFGNSSGDYSMFGYTLANPDHPALALTVNHDDAEREYGTEGGSASMVALAAQEGWSVISMKDDFATVFAGDVRKAS